MIQAIEEVLKSVEVTKPINAGPLQVFGLRRGTNGGLEYTLLDDAMEAHTLEVQEVSESGSVPSVTVNNLDDAMVLMIAGEHLIGAKQNRTLNASVLVPGKSSSTINVSCVERGRWGYRSHHFGSHRSSSHSALRRMLMKSSLKGYRKTGQPRSDQGEVWREVDRKLCAMGSVSGTDALEQAYEDRQARLDEILQQAKVPADCCGVVFAFGGRLVGMDLFDRPETLQRLFPKLLRSYAIDAMEVGDAVECVKLRSVRKWVREAAHAQDERFDSPGVGDDVRLWAKDLTGACLMVEGTPVHMELFAE